MTCYLLATNAFDTNLEYSVASSGSAEVGTGSLNVDLDDSFSQGYYSLWCFLPGYSGVIGYRVDEFQPTEDDAGGND